MAQGLGNVTVYYKITVTFVLGREIPGRVTQISIPPLLVSYRTIYSPGT